MRGANSFYKGLLRYLNERQLKTLASATVGIAGLGGLGSNVAMLLARSGILNFILIDYDKVEWSNLNRQQYWPEQVGLKKTAALSYLMRELNPELNLICYEVKITCENVGTLTKNAAIWVEALDGAENKAMLLQAIAGKCDFYVTASGICGIGGRKIEKKLFSSFCLVGDGVTGDNLQPPFAPRVTLAASLMADAVLEHILTEQDNKEPI